MSGGNNVRRLVELFDGSGTGSRTVVKNSDVYNQSSSSIQLFNYYSILPTEQREMQIKTKSSKNQEFKDSTFSDDCENTSEEGIIDVIRNDEI